jgi:cytosine deaminase
MLPNTDHYWLRNARIPEALLVKSSQGKNRQWSAIATIESDSLLQVDLEIMAGTIASIATAGTIATYSHPSVDLKGGMVYPCFVDLHTHLDKGQVWSRSPNPDGSFASAIATIQQDAQTWTAEDLYHRMQFGLKCSYAHGTQAVRTHLDATGNLAALNFEVFQQLQQEWADRLILQSSCLVPLEYYTTSAGAALADLVAEVGGVMGGFVFMNPDLESQIKRLIELAKDRHLSLDLHTDENDDPDSVTLRLIAEAVIKHRFSGKVICGHCCSLAVQSDAAINQTIQLVKQAKIGIVSLPMCNLYLQDRKPGRTPRWRGVTLLHELKAAGVPVAIASDNCRDPFHSFGDHDALEVFSLSAKIAHLDRPYGDWCRTITMTPADLMNLPTVGRVGVGLAANLVLFKARGYSELFARPQSDRLVLRNGKAIDTTLPDYAELDQ